jgi:hypothetical protein
MFRLDLGSSGRYCDGLSRRSFLQLGAAGFATLGLPFLKSGRAESIARKNTSVILIWLDGGPSHMDMYDMKPEASSDYRGIFHPIASNVPGIEVCELMTRHAAIADK